MSSFSQAQLAELKAMIDLRLEEFQNPVNMAPMAILVNTIKADLDSVMGDGKTLVAAISAKQAEVSTQLEVASRQMQESTQRQVENGRKDQEIRERLDVEFGKLTAQVAVAEEAQAANARTREQTKEEFKITAERASAEIEKVKSEVAAHVADMQVKISNHVESRMNEVSRLAGEGGGGKGGGGSAGGKNLNNPKDTVLSKIGDSPTKADFLLWR